jgi:hypothetical protein
MRWNVKGRLSNDELWALESKEGITPRSLSRQEWSGAFIKLLASAG